MDQCIESHRLMSEISTKWGVWTWELLHPKFVWMWSMTCCSWWYARFHDNDGIIYAVGSMLFRNMHILDSCEYLQDILRHWYSHSMFGIYDSPI